MMTYRDLLREGWRMNDIDDMNFLGWMRVMAYSAKKADWRTRPGHIDGLAIFARGAR